MSFWIYTSLAPYMQSILVGLKLDMQGHFVCNFSKADLPNINAYTKFGENA